MAAPPLHPKPSSRTFATVSFTTSSAASDSVDLTGLSLCSIQMSTAWTDAKVGLRTNTDGSTNYYDVYGSTGDLLTFSATANRIIALDPAVTRGVQKLQLVSESSSGTGVNQAAARVVKLGLAKLR